MRRGLGNRVRGIRYNNYLLYCSRHAQFLVVKAADPEKMGRIAALCSNRARKRISLHTWAGDPGTAEQWNGFGRRKRAQWAGPIGHSVLCSGRFEAGCFDPHRNRMLPIGYGRTRQLLLNVVPTIWEERPLRSQEELRENSRVSLLF